MGKLKDIWAILRSKYRFVMVYDKPFNLVIAQILVDDADITEFYRQTHNLVGITTEPLPPEPPKKKKGQNVHRNNSHSKDKKA